MTDNKSKEISVVDLASKIDKYMKRIRFGSVTLVIQDGKVVQIESHEKERLH